MSSATIMEALFTHVATLPDAPPIAWPNRTFPGLDDQGRPAPLPESYLRVQFLPNVTARLFIGSTEPHQHRGMLQVSVVRPLNEGEARSRREAGAVADHFPPDLRLSRDGLTVRVTKRPDIGGVMLDDTRAMVPVTVEWECLA